MKKLLSVFIPLLLCLGFSPGKQTPPDSWTAEEWSAANTAGGITWLSAEEKNVICYLNLARLFPQRFSAIELVNNSGTVQYAGKESAYLKSLKRELATRKPVRLIQPNEVLQKSAECFARESGNKGSEGHKRKSCAYDYMGECCSYGYKNGREIVLQLLIDEDVKSLGHRIICLNDFFSEAGVSIHSHKKYTNCCVIDFR